MTRRRLLPIGVAVGIGLPAIALSSGIEPLAQEAPPPAVRNDTVQLVFEREVFAYPGHARRNPFRPLTGAADTGPRFEELWLMGTMVDPAPGASVALLGRIGAGGAAGGTTYRLRVGERIGNVRVVEIRNREIIVEVEEFGMRERRTLEQRRTAPQATGGDAPPADPPARDDQADTTTPPPDTIPPPGGSGYEADLNGTGGNR